MLQFTIIANTPTNSILYINIKETWDVLLIAELFAGNPYATSIPCLQIASSEFKEKLYLLDTIGERSYALKSYFEAIPTNQHFLFLPGHIDDKIQIYIYTKRISCLDGIPLESSDMEKIVSYMYNHYEIRTFQGDERKNIGESNKSKRKCRFCGKSVPEVKFKQKAHAVSESLGNKGLICNEECDDCNKRFSETIEPDISNFFRFHIILNRVKGKNGIPTLKGNEISITVAPPSHSVHNRDTMMMKVENMPITHDPHEIAQFLSQQFLFSNVKYIPQNIYKCFCKYVLSLIDSQYLPYFKDTIKWINEPLSLHKLPPLWYYIGSTPKSPSLAIMTRKHNHKEIPYCWAIINVARIQFMFIIPFCSLDKYKFVNKNRINFFLDSLKNIMQNVELHPVDFNGITPLDVKIDFHFEISHECIEGRDYCFYNSNL